MINKVKYFTGLLVLVTAISGCYYDHEENLYPAEITLPDTVTYVGHIQPLISGNCALGGCHVNGTSLPPLTTYSEVRALGESGKLRQRVVVVQTMPPSGPLPTSQQKLIDKWLNTGYTEK